MGIDRNVAATPAQTTYTSIAREGKRKDLRTVETLLTEVVRILYENDEAIKATDDPALIKNYEAALSLAWGTLGRIRCCNKEICA